MWGGTVRGCFSFQISPQKPATAISFFFLFFFCPDININVSAETRLAEFCKTESRTRKTQTHTLESQRGVKLSRRFWVSLREKQTEWNYLLIPPVSSPPLFTSTDPSTSSSSSFLHPSSSSHSSSFLLSSRSFIPPVLLLLSSYEVKSFFGDVWRRIQKADGVSLTHTHTHTHTHTYTAKSVRDKMGKGVENVSAVVRNTEGILQQPADSDP